MTTSIHHLLRTHGLEIARTLVTDKTTRRELETAAAVMTEESETLGCVDEFIGDEDLGFPR